MFFERHALERFKTIQEFGSMGSPRRLSSILAFSFLLVATIVRAQNGPAITGLFPNRDYLSLQPFELIDTSTSNVILHFDDLTLPANGGRQLQFQRIFNNQGSVDGQSWHFAINGLPMRIVERLWPAPGTPIADDYWSNLAYVPQFFMPDGTVRSMVFVQAPSSTNQSTLDWVQTADFWKYQRTAQQLHLPDGLVAQYDKVNPQDPTNLNLRLASFVDVFGNVVSLSWTLSDPTNLDSPPSALTVTQNLGNNETRTIVIALDITTQLATSMTYDDGVRTRVWTYEYDTTPEGANTGALRHVNLPHYDGDDAIEWAYDYSSDPGTGAGISRIVTPQGGEIDYSYGLADFPDGAGGTRQLSILESRTVGGVGTRS